LSKGYQIEKLQDWEQKSLREKFSVFSIGNKESLKGWGLILVILGVCSFVFPFIPPRYGSGRWTPPTTMQEYTDKVAIFLMWAPIFVILVALIMSLRGTIDLKLGYKKTADFEITTIIDLVSIKILVLDGWRLFSIGKRKEYFDKIELGFRIEIKRTGTHRLISYYVHQYKRPG
jgi:hypothetical protein